MTVAELLLGLRWILGATFVGAGAMKVRASQSLEQAIASYDLAPVFLHRPIARSLPSLEIGLGAACILGVLPTLTGWVACALLLTFASAVAWNLTCGRRFACGCGTTLDTTISWELVARNLVLATIAAAVALGPSGSLALWRGTSGVPNPVPAMSQLLPVPMIVILMIAASRLTFASRFVWKDLDRRPRQASGPDLSIVRVTGSAGPGAKTE